MTRHGVILLQLNHLLSVCDDKNTESFTHLHPIYPDEGDRLRLRNKDKNKVIRKGGKWH